MVVPIFPLKKGPLLQVAQAVLGCPRNPTTILKRSVFMDGTSGAPGMRSELGEDCRTHHRNSPKIKWVCLKIGYIPNEIAI